MISNFAASLAFVLQDEGGNDDDPDDHGGRTSRGITQRVWDAWLQLHVYFDMAVNAGPHRATVLLQRAIGIADDGIFGPITLLSATKADPKLLIPRFTEKRIAFYKSLNQPKFLKGWINRAHRVEDRAMAMIKGVAA